MKLTKSFVAVTSALALAATPLFAGTGKTFKETVVVEEEPTPWYNASLSTGYDSLYMFRGANVLRGSGYGPGLWWTNADFTWNITDNDFLTIGAWMAFGLDSSSTYSGYRELDTYVKYTRTIGDLALSLGYTNYYVFPDRPGNLYANELSASVAYDVDLGFMSLTPSVAYFFNLGPDSETGYGSVATASSFLNFRLDGSIPVIADVVSIDPWAALGLNFGYNLDGSLEQFDGLNNLEFGVSVPWQVNEVITLAGYVAYSYAFENLWGTTQPNTFWGGAKVAFAF